MSTERQITTTTKYRSPLRYPGGKQKAVKMIASHLPPSFSEYREPFVGGGSFYFYIYNNFPHLKKFWINDLNTGLIHFWSKIANNQKEVTDRVQKLKDKLPKGRSLYDSVLNYKGESSINKAICFFILNRITFSGTVESGGYSEQAFKFRFTQSSIDRLSDLSGCFQNTLITNRDYRDVILNSGEDVFIFLDPPYLGNSKSRLYGKKGILHTNFDHERLARDLSYCPHKWLLTYDDCADVRSLFSKYNIRELELQYSMNNYKQSRAAKGKELIITNY
jgi:DNA adenine methylase